MVHKYTTNGLGKSKERAILDQGITTRVGKSGMESELAQERAILEQGITTCRAGQECAGVPRLK